jgi:hypothetical protein
MTKLLNQLETFQQKQPFQTYKVKHGIELFEVLVPVQQAPLFEQQFNQLTDKSKRAIIELVMSFNGKVRD